MTYDYSAIPPSRDPLELIPADTIASVQLRIRPGGVGEDNLLKRSKDGGCEMLDVEYVVVDGPFAKRKFWTDPCCGNDLGPCTGGRHKPRHAPQHPRVGTRHPAR